MKLRSTGETYGATRKVAVMEKGVPALDADGNPIVREERYKRFRYVLDPKETTPEEMILFKRFKTQDGDYYREDVEFGGAPTHSFSTFRGYELDCKIVPLEDGRLVLVVNTFEEDVDRSMIENDFKDDPDMQHKLNQKIYARKISGEPMKRTKLRVSEPEETL